MTERVTIDEETIQKAANLLLGAASGATVILFGSYAQGQAHPDSDLDFLVIEPELTSRMNEMVRLRDVLRPLRIPVDVLVTSREQFEKWSKTPGSVYYEAAHNGRIFDAAA